MSRRPFLSRRQLVRGVPAAAAIWATPGVFAEELAATARLTEGPFYPDRLPLDTDNDLLFLNDSITPAVGEVTHLSGRVLRTDGSPMRNAFVEIWQVDAKGAYIHSQSSNADQRDSNFQGYGRFLTDAKGRYYFRTVKPVAYPGRTPHIHVGISRGGHRIFTSQILIKGHPANQRDGVFRTLQDPATRSTVMTDFRPIKDSKIGELEASFDIVLGRTAHEDDAGRMRGGVGKPNRVTGKRG